MQWRIATLAAGRWSLPSAGTSVLTTSMATPWPRRKSATLRQSPAGTQWLSERRYNWRDNVRRSSTPAVAARMSQIWWSTTMVMVMVNVDLYSAMVKKNYKNPPRGTRVIVENNVASFSGHGAYDFLSVINCNLSSISHRVRDCTGKSKTNHSTLVWAVDLRDRPANFLVKLNHANSWGSMLLFSETVWWS